MLYDQAQLVTSYLEVFQITKDPFYSRIAEETLQYVMRDMAAPEGGFYTAEDADSLPSHDSKKKTEGAFYVRLFDDIQTITCFRLMFLPQIWSEEEIDRLLGKSDAQVFKQYYGFAAEGNVDPDRDPHDEFTGRSTLLISNTALLVPYIKMLV